MDKTITVKGIGRASAKPDYIVLSIRLSTEDPDYEKAMAYASKAVDQLAVVVEKRGFEKGSLKTTDFNVSAKYNSVRDANGNYRSIFRGYEVSHSLKLAFDFDMKRLAEALSGFAGSLLNPDISIAFTVKDPSNVSDELLRSATENARHKAEVLSSAAGVKLGDLLHIDYNWTEIQFASRTRYALPEGAMEMAAESSFTADIDPEDIDVSDTATFVWEIKP